MDSHFSPNVPHTSEMVGALHITQGLVDIGDVGWGGGPKPEKAMAEFSQALRLAPNSLLANYFYRYGWHYLPLKSPIEITKAQKATAALRKAAATGEENVKRKPNIRCGASREEEDIRPIPALLALIMQDGKSSQEMREEA